MTCGSSVRVCVPCIDAWAAFAKTAQPNYHLLPALASKANTSAMPFKVPTPLSQASVEKRSAEGASPQQAKKAKLPPLSDLVAMEAAPKRQGAQRLPAVAPLNVCVYKARPPLSLRVEVAFGC